MVKNQTDDLKIAFSDDVPMTSRRRPMTYPMTSPLLQRVFRGPAWGHPETPLGDGSMTLINFHAAPEVGTVLRLDEQVYELRDVEAYIRQDGVASALLVWESACPACGVGFVAKTGLSTHSINRRCVRCRKPNKPVKGKRGRRLKVEVTYP